MLTNPCLLTMGSTPVQHSVLNVKALLGAFNQEKALVGAFSVIVQLVVEPMDRFAAQFVPITPSHQEDEYTRGHGHGRHPPENQINSRKTLLLSNLKVDYWKWAGLINYVRMWWPSLSATLSSCSHILWIQNICQNFTKLNLFFRKSYINNTKSQRYIQNPFSSSSIVYLQKW